MMRARGLCEEMRREYARETRKNRRDPVKKKKSSGSRRNRLIVPHLQPETVSNPLPPADRSARRRSTDTATTVFGTSVVCVYIRVMCIQSTSKIVPFDLPSVQLLYCRHHHYTAATGPSVYFRHWSRKQLMVRKNKGDKENNTFVPVQLVARRKVENTIVLLLTRPLPRFSTTCFASFPLAHLFHFPSHRLTSLYDAYIYIYMFHFSNSPLFLYTNLMRKCIQQEKHIHPHTRVRAVQ